ncbi:MAG: hypothetical protein U5R30_16440 [Deltaproteobacteria bacterium]|nr:hypothetical protein [Deltaproteobacteria bacterium]
MSRRAKSGPISAIWVSIVLHPPPHHAGEAGPGSDQAAAADAGSLRLACNRPWNNRRRPASRYAVATAEAQARQALAGHSAQISAKGGYQLMDEDPNFIPANSFTLPMGGTIPITIPGVGTAAHQRDHHPAEDIKLMDKEFSGPPRGDLARR